MSGSSQKCSFLGLPSAWPNDSNTSRFHISVLIGDDRQIGILRAREKYFQKILTGGETITFDNSLLQRRKWLWNRFQVLFNLLQALSRLDVLLPPPESLLCIMSDYGVTNCTDHLLLIYSGPNPMELFIHQWRSHSLSAASTNSTLVPAQI